MSQKLQLKRNYTIFSSKDDALAHIESVYSTLEDGEIVLCRYEKGYTIIESLDELQIQDNEIKISNKEGEKNFLEIDSENNGLKVIGIDADKVSTQEITIVGTPLADLILSKRPEMDKISGNVQEILELLLSEELWPENIGIIEAKISGSVSVPSPSNLVSGVTSGSVVEVGTTCVFNKLTISEPTISKTGSTVTGLTYGYSFSNNNTRVSTSTTITYSSTLTMGVDSGRYYIIQNVTGFTNSDSKESSGDVASNVIIDSRLVYISEGENKMTVDYITPSVSATFEKIPTIYGCSNLGKTKDEDKYKFKEKQPFSVTDTVVSGSSSFTVTGARYSFVGASNGSFVANSDNVRSLGKYKYNKNNTTAVTANAGNTQVIIAFPSSWGSLTEVSDNNALGASLLGNFVLTTTQVKGANDYDGVDYNVYVYTSDVELGAISYKIKIE